MKKYGINADKAEELVRQYDIVTTERKDLREIPGDFSTPAEQYKTAPFLHYQDYHYEGGIELTVLKGGKA